MATGAAGSSKIRRIETFLGLVVSQNGSDLHLAAGNPPRLRINGDLYPVKYRELSADETTNLLEEIMPDQVRRQLGSRYNVDFAIDIPELARFRVNIFRHLNGLGAVFRVIPSTIRTLEELQAPRVFKTLCRQRNGLILVTGPTGSGKSTTLAAMLDFVNRDRKGHVVTIEDPVEFVHAQKGCLISQREVGRHTSSFAAALHSAVREDPDVILVGELRDLETVSLAVTAAELGILIFSTLHTNGAPATIDRVINMFPAREQPRIRAMLSTSLRGIISQQLVRRADGKGRLAVHEILVNTSGISNIIREGKTDQLLNAVQLGAAVGMQSLDQGLRTLVESELISGEEAYRKAVNKHDFEQLRAQGRPT
jgi:twitching motility protein PilT